MKSILLIGLGTFGKHVATELNALGHEVMAVDRDEEKVNDILSIVTSAQIGDSTNMEFLSSLGVDNYDVCIVTVSEDFQSSLETTANLKDLGARHVVSRADSNVHAKFLLRNGADEILYPESYVAKWASVCCLSSYIVDYMELDNDRAIFEVTVPPEWVGKTVAEIDICRKYNVSIVALQSNDDMSVVNDPNTVLMADMVMLLLGKYEVIHKCLGK